MKISTSLDSFSKFSKLLAKVANEKSPSPILANARITASPSNQISITATDLITDVTATLSAEVTDPGRVIVPAKQLSDWLDKVTGDTVKAELKDAKFKLTCGRSTLTLPTVPPDDFPDVDCLTTFDLAQTDKSTFSNAITKTIFAVADDLNRIVSNLCLNFTETSIEVVAADGVRIAKYRIPIDVSNPRLESYMLTEKSCKLIVEALKLSEGPISLMGCGNKLVVSGESLQIATLRVEGQYINYDQIFSDLLPVSFLTTDTLSLKRAAQIVSATASDDNKYIDLLSVGGNTLRLQTSRRVYAQTFGEGETEIDAVVDKGVLDMAINSDFFLDAVSSIDSPSIALRGFEFGNGIMLAVTEPDDVDLRKNVHIIAPFVS